MIENIANITVTVAGFYMLVGFLFAIPFAFSGAARIDSTAANGTLGFKLLLIPGSIAFWPLLLRRWMRKVGNPPEEKNAHRVAACAHHEREQKEQS